MLAAPTGLSGCASPSSALPTAAPPPVVIPWIFRWLAFRIMLGAGLIKVRGANCWLDLTAMCHHLETQPIPNPLSRMFHNLPRGMLLFATASNHIIELAAPWLLLLPLNVAQSAFGATHILFQFALILTGNLSFLNWLTIIPGLWCFDDAVLVGMLPPAAAQRTAEAVMLARASAREVTALGASSILAFAHSTVVVAAIAWLSVPVYKNLLGLRGGSKQRMNSAFERRLVILPSKVVSFFDQSRGIADQKLESDSVRHGPGSEDVSLDVRSLRLLNSYGAFGSVSIERIEIVFEGTCDGITWHSYKFKAAVDDPLKRPGWLAPYHLRLDWCRWIASCRGRRSSGLQEPWVLSFVAQLLRGDIAARQLLAKKGGDPFEAAGVVPKWIRADLYSYRFAQPPRVLSEPYWLRDRVGSYLPPLNLEDVATKLAEHGLLT